VGASTNYSIYKSDEKTNGRTEETMQFTRDLPFWTQDDTNSTLTGTLFYNFASDSLDAKIDAQLSYANYQNDSDRLTITLTLMPTQ
jgi:hypothetical protein